MTNFERDQMAREHHAETRQTLQGMVGLGMVGLIFWLSVYNIFF